MSPRRGKEKNVIAVPGKPAQTRRLAENALAPVPEDGIAEPLRGDEGDTGGCALVARCHANSQELVIEPPPAREDPLKISLGLDGLHRPLLDGEALATLGTTTGQDGTAALGGHAGAEPVSGGALALVRLVRTLHSYSSRLWV